MSILLAEGFDAWGTSQLPGTYNNVVQGSGAVVSIATPGFLGTGNYLLLGGTANPAALTYVLPGAPLTSVIVGFRFLWTASSLANQEIFVFQDNGGSTLGTLNVTTSGQLFYQNNNGGAVAITPASSIRPLVWQYIECSVTFNQTTGAVTLKVNNATLVVVTGVNTTGSSSSTCTLAGPLNSNTGVTGMGYDDTYFFNTSGSVNNSFAGPNVVFSTVVNGNGRVNQWTANGAGTNYQCVDQYPPDNDTTYVSSSTVNQVDDYVQLLNAAATSVIAVTACIYARDDNSPARVVSVGYGNGTTESFDGGSSLNQTYSYIIRSMDVNPLTTVAWTLSDITAGQVCIKVIS